MSCENPNCVNGYVAVEEGGGLALCPKCHPPEINMTTYRDNETNPADIAHVLFICNQGPEHGAFYGKECDYPEHGCDPRCPTCGHLMVRVSDIATANGGA